MLKHRDCLDLILHTDDSSLNHGPLASSSEIKIEDKIIADGFFILSFIKKIGKIVAKLHIPRQNCHLKLPPNISESRLLQILWKFFPTLQTLHLPLPEPRIPRRSQRCKARRKVTRSRRSQPIETRELPELPGLPSDFPSDSWL